MKTLSQGAKGPGREFLQFPRSSLLTGELGTRGRTDRVHEDTWICNSTIGTCTLSEPLFMSPVPYLHCFLLQEEYYITPSQNLLQGGASQTTLTLLLTLTHNYGSEDGEDTVGLQFYSVMFPSGKWRINQFRVWPTFPPILFYFITSTLFL